MLTEQPDRATFLGGSDAAAVLGISPWRTPLDVYLEKVGGAPRGEFDESRLRAIARGKRMEPYVLDLLAEETGLQIIARNRRYMDNEFPFLACEVDAEDDAGENIEIKTVSPFKAREWGEEATDEIPVHYTAQAMHGLMITGRPVCIFGVLIGGDDLRVYRVERDDETIHHLRAKEVAFWREHVQKRIPPEPSSAQDILWLYGKDSGTAIEASIEIKEAVQELKQLNERIKELGSQADKLRGDVELYMRDAAILAWEGKPLLTWKTQKASRFNHAQFKKDHADLFAQYQKITTSRVMRIK